MSSGALDDVRLQPSPSLEDQLETVQRMMRNTLKAIEITGGNPITFAALEQLRAWENSLSYWIARKKELDV